VRNAAEVAGLLVAASLLHVLGAHLGWYHRLSAWMSAKSDLDRLADLLVSAVLVVVGLLVFAVRRWRNAEGEALLREQAQAALEVLKDELDERVLRRTAELRDANRALQTEVEERRLAQDALRESENHYRVLFDNMLNGYAHCRMIPANGPPQDFRYLKVNRAFEHLTGLKDVTGRKVTEVIPGFVESDRQLLEAYGRVAQSGTPERFERYVGALGMWFSIWVYSPAKGEFVALFDVITERKKAEVALRESEERYRQLFDNNPLPMWLYDQDTLRFLAVNESAIRHYGYSREEFLGMTMESIGPAGGGSQGPDPDGSFEARHRRRDGTAIEVEVFSRPLVLGGLNERLELVVDITEKKVLQQQFLRAQRLESLGMLASGIAHDFNNVLAPIVFAGPLLRDSVSDPRDQKILDTLERSAERGVGLVRQILSFAHGATGEPQLIQVKHLARDVISMVTDTFPKSIEIEHHIPGDVWTIEGNPTQIHQVLINLCLNARDAMPGGGKLTVTAYNRRLGQAEAEKIPGGRPGDWLVLEVRDNGSGIPPLVLARIWEPFFTTKAASKGTGLGLATVRGIVANHRGFIELETEVGTGTVFRIFLPAAESQPEAPDGADPAVLPRGNGELIIVVEDEQAFRDMIADILGANGYRVLSFSDGLEALRVFTTRSSEASLVITDVDMPNLNGAELARLVCLLRPDILVIAMSGLSGEGEAGQGVELARKRTHAFLRKPFKAELLLATVSRLFAARK
jgi:PAS domain S-box-containing protein